MVQNELCWRWTMPNGAVTLMIPMGFIDDHEWDEIEDFIRMCVRTAKRSSKPVAARKSCPEIVPEVMP